MTFFFKGFFISCGTDKQSMTSSQMSESPHMNWMLIIFYIPTHSLATLLGTLYSYKVGPPVYFKNRLNVLWYRFKKVLDTLEILVHIDINFYPANLLLCLIPEMLFCIEISWLKRPLVFSDL